MRSGARIVATGSMAADQPWNEAASLGVQKAGLRNLVSSIDTTVRDEGVRAVIAGIAIGNIAADRADITHLRIGNQKRRFAQDRDFFCQQLRVDQFMLGRHRTNDDIATILVEALKIGNAGKIDEMGGAREPQFHHRNKTMPARNGTRVFTQTAEQANRFLDRCRTVIGKWPRYHGYTSRMPNRSAYGQLRVPEAGILYM